VIVALTRVQHDYGDLDVWVTRDLPMTDGPRIVVMDDDQGPVRVVVLGPGKETIVPRT
jgi:hypothetical protein